MHVSMRSSPSKMFPLDRIVCVGCSGRPVATRTRRVFTQYVHLFDLVTVPVIFWGTNLAPVHHVLEPRMSSRDV